MPFRGGVRCLSGQVRLRARLARWGVLAVALTVPSSCTERPDVPAGTPSFTVRDSAGVEIVESRRARLPDSLAWALSSEPVAQIGSPEGGLLESLFGVGEVTRLSDGQVALIDRGTQELRIIDPRTGEGTAVGGEGEGPGEFEDVQALRRLPGDSLLVFDRANRRVTIFSPSGDLAATIPLRLPGGRTRFTYLRRDLDGSHVLWARGAVPMDPVGIYRMIQPVTRASADGQTAEEIFSFEADESITIGSMTGAPPFGRSGNVFPFGADAFVTYFNSWFGYTVRDSGGAPVRIVRLPREAPPVTSVERDEWMDEMMGRVREIPGSTGDSFAEFYGNTQFPPNHPMFDGLLVDRLDNVWIREVRAEDAEGPIRWSVFDAAGVWQCDVLTPSDVQVAEIGADYVLALWRDELDIQYVRVYALEKPAL